MDRVPIDDVTQRILGYPFKLRDVVKRIDGVFHSLTSFARGARIRDFLNVTLALSSLPNNDLEWPQCGNVVMAPAGQILGVERTSRDGRSYHAFLGVPYAQPPVGDLRFKPPKPIAKFESEYGATEMPKNCLQNVDPLSDENCLYLNVYRPTTANNTCSEKALPVLFYIHGGAFTAGSTGPTNNADYLMDEEVILVSPNYRLGIFGFPSFGNDILPGNLGVKDLVLALEWVKDNILAFGGDPGMVTVFGGSGGGALSHILLKSPASENLVARAYSYSGTINPIWSLIGNDHVKNGTMFVAHYVKCCKSEKNCTANKEVLQCMQKAKATDILMGATKLSLKTGNVQLLPFAPVIEPKGVPGAAITEDLSLRPSSKPWMTSVTNGEYSIFVDISQTTVSRPMLKHLKTHYFSVLKNLIQVHTNDTKSIKIGSNYLKSAYLLGDFEEGFAKLFMDYYFIYPEIFNIKRHEGPKWMSSFEYKGELSMGPSNKPGHSDQGIFLFNYRELYPGVSANETADDYKISKRMIQYLVNFAAYGDPTPADKHPKTIWKRFTKNEVLRTRDSSKEDVIDETCFDHFEEVYGAWYDIIGWGYAK